MQQKGWPGKPVCITRRQGVLRQGTARVPTGPLRPVGKGCR